MRLGASTPQLYGDLLKAQKRLFQTAEAATKEGKLKEAQALFELLLRKYPESTLRDFARQGLDRVCNNAIAASCIA